MLYKSFQISIILLMLQLSCKNIDDNNLNNVKKFIVSEYLKYDAQYFNDYEICVFKDHIMNNIKEIKYNKLSHGFSFWYSGCSYNNYGFVLIKKNSNEKLYYLGFSDFVRYKNELCSKYIEKTQRYESSIDSLYIINCNNSHELFIINQLVNECEFPYVNNIQKDNKAWTRIYSLQSLIWNIYYTHSSKIMYTYTPIFTYVNDMKSALLELKIKGEEHDVDIKKIIKYYEKLDNHIMGNSFVVKIQNFGIYIFTILESNNKFTIKKEFIPSLKISKIVKTGMWEEYYKDCKEKFNR